MKNITLSAAQIAEITGGRVCGDADRSVTGVASVKEATAEQLSFVGNKRYEELLATTKAGIVLVCPDLAKSEDPERTLIACDNVDLAFAKVVAMFAEEAPAAVPGVHPSAVVDPTAKLGSNVSIGANAVIERDAVIGDNTVIGAGTYIGHEVSIGANCNLAPNVTVMFRCRIGNKAVIHSGVVIGADGFGFIPGPAGLVKVPQTGIVQIDDDVEIGANTTIDRARFGRTWIKSNVKIDNQVMVAHNVTVGESSILVAQCGIAGSAELGRGVVLAAKAGVNGHITLGDGVQVAGTSSVLRSMPAGAVGIGTPAETQREFMARLALPKKVQKLDARIKELEALVEELKKAAENR
ncbi:MAG: UDP-3-O-(3-hydroxymyristoyl)glucosamine N-acyltransferase [Lentisphaeria bacterium]|nr:UDP-3-O-(3-hydroxymyristoyl)glucosamine N-acyltransferase [Lentisphaeria bacterium]